MANEDVNIDTLAERVKAGIRDGDLRPADVRSLSDGLLEMMAGFGFDVAPPTAEQMAAFSASIARASSPQGRAEFAAKYPHIAQWLPEVSNGER